MGREDFGRSPYYRARAATGPLRKVEVHVLKKVLAVATLAGALTGTAAVSAAPAQAAAFCAHVSVTVNDTNQVQDICTPV